MSKVYNKGDIEKQAREFLSPMKGVCPDNVWKELNYRLNEDSIKNEKTWRNSLYTPKTLALVVVGISIITIAVWKFYPGVSQATPKNISVLPQKEVQVANTEVNIPVAAPVVVAKDSALLKNDHGSAADQAKTGMPVSKNTLVQSTPVKQAGYNLNNHPTTLSIKMKDSSASYKGPRKRDTLAKENNKTALGDSAISVAKGE